MSANSDAQLDAAAVARQLASALKRRLPANIELDDLMSEASIAAWLAQRDFDGRGDLQSFVAWRVNCGMHDYLREQSHTKRGQPPVILVEMDEVEHLASEECPLADCSASELRADIVHAVAALPPRQQEVFLRVHVGGDRPHELAADFDVHASRITQLMQSAKESLQWALLKHARDRGYSISA